jgi:hypothetical protein
MPLFLFKKEWEGADPESIREPEDLHFDGIRLSSWKKKGL